MMKTKTKITLQKAAITVTAILFGLMVTFTAIALENKSAINSYLGSQTFKTVQIEGESGDTEYYKSDYETLAQLIPEAQKMSQKLEEEGAVLLKNTANALPMGSGSRKVSLFSVSSVDPAYGGRGSAQSSSTPGAVETPPITPQIGLENAGFTVNQTLIDFYTNNLSTYKRTTKSYFGGEDALKDAPWNDLIAAPGVENSFAQHGDAAIFIVTRIGGEAADLKMSGFSDATDGDYLKLSPTELTVLNGIKAKKAAGVFSKIIVMLNSTPQMEADFLKDDAIDAAVWVGNPGQCGFNAVGDILAGKANPSGKLSDLYWTSHDYNPVLSNFGDFTYSEWENKGLPAPPVMFGQNYNKYVVYQEGIYVGYRYAETRYEDVVTGRANAGSFNYGEVVSYPFGYGDSYTDFEFSEFKANREGDKYKVSVKVTNKGDTYSGKEVVQIYVQKPYNKYDVDNGIEKAAVELVGFAKTKSIEPGLFDIINVEIDAKHFTSYDANGEKTYIISEGDHYLTAAQNSHDAINNILAVKGYTTENGMDASGNPAMVEKFTLKFDAKTYSKSKANGNKITNLFDEADITKYSGKGDNNVRYMTRSDWNGTVKTRKDLDAGIRLKMTQQMANEMNAQNEPEKLSTDDIAYPEYGKVAGLVLADMREDSDGNKIPYDAEVWDTFMNQLTWDEIAFLCSTGLRKTGGVESIVKPETRDHNGPNGLTEAYGNGERGLAARKADPDGNKKPVYYPSTGVVAATFNPELSKEFGNILGEEALWAGYAGFYGIAMNLHRSPYEGRIAEYYSEDPFLTGALATQEVLGLQARGCSAYIKHFALNDQDTNRQGVNVWASEQTLRELYFKPFEMTVVEGGAKNAMASFTRIGTVNCPQSKALMTDFLRGELEMTGFVVTDMWQIGYINKTMPLFVLAGCDIPDGDIDAQKPFDNFKTGYGELAHAMRESAKRILYTTCHSNAMNGFDSNTRIIMIMPDWLIAVTVIDVVLGALLLAAAGWTVADFIIRKKKA